MKIAIVHDWLVTIGGAEKVLRQLLKLYPEADVFCLFDLFDAEQRKEILGDRKTEQSRFGSLPLLKSQYRRLLPIFFGQIEQLDLSGYDMVISSSHSIAKGVRTCSHQLHVCYCHTPVRYAWDMRKTYLEQIPSAFRRVAYHRIKQMQAWDLNNSKYVNAFIANSQFVADRIKKNYKREAVVIHPPVDTDHYKPAEAQASSPHTRPYYLVVSRLVFYKRVELIVEAFNQLPDHDLIIIGEGPQSKKLKKVVRGQNIKFLDFCSNATTRQFMQHAEAVIFAAIEDFGITCVEAQACGTPVICFDHGGYKETVVHLKTGILFSEQSVSSLRDAIEEFESGISFHSPSIRNHAIAFSEERFLSEMRDYMSRLLDTDEIAEFRK